MTKRRKANKSRVTSLELVLNFVDQKQIKNFLWKEDKQKKTISTKLSTSSTRSVYLALSLSLTSN
jgi:hypothetical protein